MFRWMRGDPLRGGVVTRLLEGDLPVGRSQAVLEQIMADPERRRRFMDEVRLHGALMEFYQGGTEGR